MKSETYHCYPHAKGWAVKRTGLRKNTKITTTRRGAEKFVLKLKNAKSIYFHDEHGRIIDFVEK